MAGVGGQNGMSWRACVGGCVILWALIPIVITSAYIKIYLDSEGSISLCQPVRVSLSITNLKLPNAACALVCDTSTALACNTFRYHNNECQLYNLGLTTGYSMAAEETNAVPFYFSLKDYSTKGYLDLALNATVTSASNQWETTFEKQLASGALCARDLCPCTKRKSHSVIMDLGSLRYVTNIHIVTSSAWPDFSQNFVAYVGDTPTTYKGSYQFGTLQPTMMSFDVFPMMNIQFITFTKNDDPLCLCLVQVF